MKRTLLITFLAFVAGLLVGSMMPRGTAAPAQIRSVKRTELLRAPITGCDNKELYVALQESGPGVAVWHYHPGDSVTYVLEGSQVRENADGKKQYHAGELIADLARQVHRTENDAPVKLLLVRVLDRGAYRNYPRRCRRRWSKALALLQYPTRPRTQGQWSRRTCHGLQRLKGRHGADRS